MSDSRLAKSATLAPRCPMPTPRERPRPVDAPTTMTRLPLTRHDQTEIGPAVLRSAGRCRPAAEPACRRSGKPQIPTLLPRASSAGPNIDVDINPNIADQATPIWSLALFAAGAGQRSAGAFPSRVVRNRSEGTRERQPVVRLSRQAEWHPLGMTQRLVGLCSEGARAAPPSTGKAGRLRRPRILLAQHPYRVRSIRKDSNQLPRASPSLYPSGIRDSGKS
jgi:hypothetical protein